MSHLVCPDCFGNPCCCGPYVCPGCQSIAGEPCAPWCPDDAIARKREDDFRTDELDYNEGEPTPPPAEGKG